LHAGGVRHTVEKFLMRVTTLFYTSHKGLHTKLWGPKVMGVSGQNVIWMWASWRGTKYIIRGKVVASPKSRPW